MNDNNIIPRHTSPYIIKDCVVWIPELKEQKHIASILSYLDNKIALNHAINRNFMITFQFLAYNLTVLLVIAHFLDSAKEREWTDYIYKGSYSFWLITSLVLIGLALVGIVPVYLGNQSGDILSVIVSIGGLGAAGYHIPMHRTGKSKVCDNRLSYAIMVILSLSCLCLLASLFF